MEPKEDVEQTERDGAAREVRDGHIVCEHCKSQMEQ